MRKFLSTTIFLFLVITLAQGNLLSGDTPAGDHNPEPELILQTGHSDLVTSLAFSPDGKQLVSSSFDKKLIVWEVDSGLQLQTLMGHTERVQSVAFSPNGKWLASAGDDKTIRIWDADGFREVTTLSGHRGSVQSVVFSPDGKWLASGDADAVILLWEVGSWSLRRTLKGHETSVRSVTFSHDSKWLVSGSSDKTSRIWEVSSGKAKRILVGHAGGVRCVAMSPDGRLVATASLDANVKIWDFETGKEVRTLTGHAIGATSVAFSPDGQLITTAGWDNKAFLWDAATGRQLLVWPQKGRVNDKVEFLPSNNAVFSPDGRYVALQIQSKIRLVEVSTGLVVEEFRDFQRSVVQNVRFAPGNTSLGSTGSLALWNFNSGSPPSFLLSGTQTSGLAFDSEGRKLASVDYGSGKDISVIDLVSGQVVQTLKGHSAEVWSVAFSPDGRLLASGSRDATVRIFDLATGGSRVLNGECGPVFSVVFSPDGRTLADGCADRVDDSLVMLWDVSSGKELRTLSGAFDSVVFSPDGRWLAAGGYKTVKLWDLTTGREVRTLIGHAGRVGGVAFSPDSRWIASGSDDETVRVWNVASGNEARRFLGHSGIVRTVAFSNDGRWIASGSHDGTVRIWDPLSGRQIVLLAALKTPGDWVAVTPEGFFDGSTVGMESTVAWKIAGRAFPLERFFIDYYSPGLLRRILSADPTLTVPQRREPKLPPEVQVTSTEKSEQGEDRLVVSVSAKDQGGGVAEVRLFQNGKLIGTQAGDEAQNSAYKFEVQLVPGENVLLATALSRDHIETRSVAVRMTREVKEPVRPALHILAVGINRYEDTALNLGFAAQDGNAIASLFEQKGKTLFGQRHIVRLFDDNATREKVLQALDEIKKTAKPEDVVVLYFAGHGIVLDKEFYFLPHEMRYEADEEIAVRKYGISASTLGKAIQGIPSLKELLILDSCQSEGALPALAKLLMFRSGESIERKATKMLARANGIYLIAASTRQQFAHEVPELGHGILAYAILSALGEQGPPLAPRSAEGLVTVHGLLQYVELQVPELSAKYHEKQYPVSAEAGMDFPLAVP